MRTPSTEPSNYLTIARGVHKRLAERIKTAGNRRFVLTLFIVLLKENAAPGSRGRLTGRQCLMAAWLIAD